jgi:hypothetical protein
VFTEVSFDSITVVKSDEHASISAALFQIHLASSSGLNFAGFLSGFHDGICSIESKEGREEKQL